MSRSIFIALGVAGCVGGGVATQSASLSADSWSCPVARDTGGNCNLSRTPFGTGKIDQIALRGGDGFQGAAIAGRAIGEEAGGFDTHDSTVVRVAIAPGGYSRWHTHPGVNLVMVLSGDIEYFTVGANGRCAQHFVSVGGGFMEMPGQVHTVRNPSATTPVEILAIFVKREADPAFTVAADQPADTACPTGVNP